MQSQPHWENLTEDDKRILNKPHFISLDLETTGLSPDKHSEIIELSAIKLDNKDETNWTKFETFVKPSITIPKKIRDLTSITSEDVDRAANPTHLFKEFYCFVGDAVIVAHNAAFEKRFLDYYMAYNQLPLENDYLDTMSIFRKLFPEAKNAKLDTFLSYFSVSNGHWHRASADSGATAEAFLKLKNAYDDDVDSQRHAIKLEGWDENTYEPETWHILNYRLWEKKPQTKAGKLRLYVRVNGVPDLDDGFTHAAKTANIYFDYKLNRWDYNGETTHVPLDFSSLTDDLLKKSHKKSLAEFVPEADRVYIS